MQVRVARPTRDLGRALAFYRDAVGLQVLSSFDEHEPSPTEEDQLVLYLGSAKAVADRAAAIRTAGYEPRRPSNPYWSREGAIAFVDPDGYWLILSPDRWR